MGLAYYLVAFDRASNAFFKELGFQLPPPPDANIYFAAETHVVYEQEMMQGEAATVLTTLVDADAKRVHLAHEMLKADGTRACMQELMFVSVNLKTKRAAAWAPEIQASIDATLAAHETLPCPAKIGRKIQISR
jgi:acyl-CoA thioester hydrolase